MPLMKAVCGISHKIKNTGICPQLFCRHNALLQNIRLRTPGMLLFYSSLDALYAPVLLLFPPCPLCHYYKASVLHMIGTGGKCQEGIPELCGYTGIIKRQ